MSCFSQARFAVRVEWGPAAIAHLAADVECVVVVDVMSFATCVSIAVDRGVHVYPCASQPPQAQAYAQQLGAVLADERDSTQYSLSPTSLYDRGLGALGHRADLDVSTTTARPRVRYDLPIAAGARSNEPMDTSRPW